MYCSGLTSIVVDASNTAYSSQDGVLYDKAMTALIQYPGGKSGEFTIPSSVTSIYDYAFETCAGLTSVTIPNSVTSIGTYAFEACSSLYKAYFLGNAPSVGSYFFLAAQVISTFAILPEPQGFLPTLYMVWLSCSGVWIIYHHTNHSASHNHHNIYRYRSMCDVRIC